MILVLGVMASSKVMVGLIREDLDIREVDMQGRTQDIITKVTMRLKMLRTVMIGISIITVPVENQMEEVGCLTVVREGDLTIEEVGLGTGVEGEVVVGIQPTQVVVLEIQEALGLKITALETGARDSLEVRAVNLEVGGGTMGKIVGMKKKKLVNKVLGGGLKGVEET